MRLSHQRTSTATVRWTRSILAGAALGAMAGASACAPGGYTRDIRQEARTWRTPAPAPTPEFPAAPLFPTWTEADDGYRMYPGDIVEFQSQGAPELNRKLTIAPDGRIHPPLVRAVMAADRTPAEISAELTQLYAIQLRNPTVTIAPESFASQKVFVGGEVARPGVYDLPGEIDPMQAVLLAGGFLNSAKRVVWVPRSRISEVGLFTQQFIRDALPVTIGFNYSIGNTRF
jgi:protein involved in polysaccharide export with SLBB domain